ncbi:zinc finger protein 653 [Dendroctonus ponderosae]|uniref:zinc finger protein 653 n=1 Tax=Dendroctonus ponderosae TaxID=77166 RepID=UPI0020357B6C|nr:zinc finger protein 653 [Dendroctonus ponderosae]
MQESCTDLVACEPAEDQQEYLSINYTDHFPDSNTKADTDQKCNNLNRKFTCIKGPKHPSTSESMNNSKHFEKYERLFIRLIKLDSTKLSQTGPSSNAKNSSQQLSSAKLDFKANLTESPLKRPKIESKGGNLLNVNKTESVRMEELLWKQFKKRKEKLGPDGSSGENIKESGISEFEIEPYEYKKTEKSVYETYVKLVTANGKTDHCCLLCPFVGQSFHQISLHYKFKHKEIPIEEMHFCNVRGCQFKTIHKGMFKWHMRRHELVGNKLISAEFTCNQCGKIFENRKGFLIHLKHMHKEQLAQNDFPCSTCKFRASIKVELESHIYKCHMPSTAKPKFTCNICGFTTICQDSFQKHLTNVHLKNN